MAAGADDDERAALAIELAHEVANLLAGIQMRAHVLERAEGGEIDALAWRAGLLVAQFRPLLAPASPGSLRPEAVLEAAKRALADTPALRVAIEVEAEGGLPAVRADPELLHALLLTQAWLAADAVPAGARVRIGARRDRETLVFWVEHPGGSEELDGWRETPRRGRGLACAVAELILRERGGALEVGSEHDVVWVALRLPIASEP
jgi:hypothetical protein